MSTSRPELGNIEDSFAFFRSFDVPKNAKVLDVGTNFGSFPAALFKQGWEGVYGVDINGDAVHNGKTQYTDLADRLFVYDGKCLPFGDNMFHAVTMFNLIEHVEPSTMHIFLSEVFRVMKNGGQLIQMTPNKPIDMIYETVRHRNFGWRTWHCSLQTPRSITHLLQRHGFIDITFYKTDLTTDYYCGRAKRYLGILTGVVVWVLSRLPVLLYPTISCIAQKPSES